MQDAAAVSVFHGIANVDEPADQLAKLQATLALVELQCIALVKLVDGFLQAVAANESHRIIRAAVRINPQPIDGHDRRVFQPAGDFGFENESGTALGTVGVRGLDALQGHFTVQFFVRSDVHLAESAARMRTEDAESLAACRQSADGHRRLVVDG